MAGRVRLVLHGTNDFTPDLLHRCIDAGVSKINVNKLVLDDYLTQLHEQAGTIPLTQLMEKGVESVASSHKKQMDICRSSNRSLGKR